MSSACNSKLYGIKEAERVLTPHRRPLARTQLEKKMHTKIIFLSAELKVQF